jgi:hypothetical protein
MNKHNQSVEASSLEVDKLRHPSEIIDEVRGYLDTSRILGDQASPTGVAMTLLHGKGSSQIDAIGNFQPGVDSSSSIEYRSTYASGRPQAKKTLGFGSPSKLHLLLDIPERTHLLEGRETSEYIGNYVLAVTAVIGEVIGDSELFVYHSYASTPDGLVYAGDVEDAFRALSEVDESADKKQLFSLLSSINNVIDDDNEAAIIVSDFMDGFDQETGIFDWEADLHNLSSKQEDLLWINRIKSRSHERLALGQIQGLDSMTVNAMNRDYSDVAKTKIARINQALEKNTGNVVEIDLDDVNVDRVIVDLLAGNSVE